MSWSACAARRRAACAPSRASRSTRARGPREARRADDEAFLTAAAVAASARSCRCFASAVKSGARTRVRLEPVLHLCAPPTPPAVAAAARTARSRRAQRTARSDAPALIASRTKPCRRSSVSSAHQGARVERFLGASDDEGDVGTRAAARVSSSRRRQANAHAEREQHVAPQRDAELDGQRQQAHVDAGVGRVEVARVGAEGEEGAHRYRSAVRDRSSRRWPAARVQW